MNSPSASSPEAILASAKRFPVGHAEMHLWIVHRRKPCHEPAAYSCRHVTIDDELQERLRRVLADGLAKLTVLRDYEYLTEDADGAALLLTAKETDFDAIRAQLMEGSDAVSVVDSDDLRNAWGYMIQAQARNGSLWGFRTLRSGWNVRQGRRVLNVALRAKKFELLKDQDLFYLDQTVDFLGHRDHVIVCDKSRFETGMNFRAGIAETAHGVIGRLVDTGLCDPYVADQVRSCIGTNLRHLRRLAAIDRSGHLCESYLDQLRQVNEEEAWGLSFVDGKLQFRPDQIELLLTLLNNDRLRSPLDAGTYDVSVKRRANIKRAAAAVSPPEHKGRGRPVVEDLERRRSMKAQHQRRIAES